MIHQGFAYTNVENEPLSFELVTKEDQKCKKDAWADKAGRCRFWRLTVPLVTLSCSLISVGFAENVI